MIPSLLFQLAEWNGAEATGANLQFSARTGHNPPPKLYIQGQSQKKLRQLITDSARRRSEFYIAADESFMEQMVAAWEVIEWDKSQIDSANWYTGDGNIQAMFDAYILRRQQLGDRNLNWAFIGNDLASTSSPPTPIHLLQLMVYDWKLDFWTATELLRDGANTIAVIPPESDFLKEQPFMDPPLLIELLPTITRRGIRVDEKHHQAIGSALARHFRSA